MYSEIIEKLSTRTVVAIMICMAIAGSVFFVAISERGDAQSIYFIDVGQGDSSLIESEGIQILIDGGPPNGKVIHEIGSILPFHDRYIDIIVITHPQNDHFGGLLELVQRYKIGLVLYSGRTSQSATAHDFERYLNRENIRGMRIAHGDSIRYGDNVLRVLLPDENTINADNVNDSSIVLLGEIDTVDILFTGDISGAIENRLIDRIDSVDVLKVAHHGSRYSSNQLFLNAIRPRLSIIQVGKNGYGHPTDEVLERLRSVGSEIFRTDMHGTLELRIQDEVIQVFTKK